MFDYEQPDYVPPSTLDGIKRLAKKIKKDRAIKHIEALDVASRLSGYQNFRNAQHALADGKAQ